LNRAKGTLVIQSNPRATRLLIRGPEFTTVLTNSTGESLLMPTDRYEVEAKYVFWEQSDNAVVTANSTSTVRIAPQFGVVQIASTHSNTTFWLSGKNNNVRLNGKSPAVFAELPIGEYELTGERNGERQTKVVWIGADRTNEALVEFKYGAITLETDPAGARVLDSDGHVQGTTPLTLQELRAGKWRFTLERNEYETMESSLDVTANQTNRFQTNLVSLKYSAAMKKARNSFDSGRYDETAEFAKEALQYKSGDPVASSLQREATGLGHLARARINGERDDFVAGRQIRQTT
jgi:PEGA domain